MSTSRIDQYADIGAAIPAGAIILFEINPDNAGTRDYRKGLASLLATAAQVATAQGAADAAGTAAAAANTNANTRATAGLATASGLTINTAKLLARLTAGVGALEEFDFSEGTFTPTFTFSTPGDLSVVYTIQTGRFLKIGKMVLCAVRLAFTPTYTTASGSARVAGLPFTVESAIQYSVPLDIVTNSVTWPTGTTSVFARFSNNTTYADFIGMGNGAVRAGLGVASFPTASARDLVFSGSVRASA